MSHVQGFLKNPETEVTVICDCDEGVIASAMRTVEKAQGKPPRFEKDIRRVVADKEVDIVAIATPNHWHALMAVWAMEHGKDVYVEKPASHNVREGAIMTAVARRTGRICQVGTQSRSNPGIVSPFGPPRVLPVVPVVPGPVVYPPAGPVVPAPIVPPGIRPGLARDFVVYFRPAPLTPWTVYGRYDTRLEATRVARYLESCGYLTRVESVPGW
jgi:hypothetical protein